MEPTGTTSHGFCDYLVCSLQAHVQMRVDLVGLRLGESPLGADLKALVFE